MKKNHHCFLHMLDEWHGTGAFPDDAGGIEGRDRCHKSTWRKHVDATHYSRTKRVVQAFKTHVERGHDREGAVEYFDALFQACGKSVGKLACKLQELELIPKRAKRGRTTTQEAVVIPMSEG